MSVVTRGVNLTPWLQFPAIVGGVWTYPHKDEITAAHIASLVALGVDTVRLPFDPAPAFLGYGWGNALKMVSDRVSVLLAGGVQTVIVSFFPDDASPLYSSAALAADNGASLGPRDNFSAFAAKLVEAFKTAKFGSNVLIEPWNEPPFWGPYPPPSAWAAIQKKTYDRIRLADPLRPVVLTAPMSNWICGYTSGSYADPAVYARDPNVFWTFHWYGPRNEVAFSHQGSEWVGNRPFLREVAGLRWPEQLSRKAGFLAALKANRPMSEAAQIDASLSPFFGVQSGQDIVDSEFAALAAWCDARSIPRSRMILGEFGVSVSATEATGAAHADAMRFASDVRLAAEAAGFPWIYYNFWPHDGGDSFSMLNANGSWNCDIVRDGLGFNA